MITAVGVWRFEIRYGAWAWVLGALGLGPRFSWVELDPVELRVRMGWAFRLAIPRSSITSAGPSPRWNWAIGVHSNLRGAWLVNGSTSGLVALDLVPPVRGWALGIPIKVKRLGVSLVDPDRFLTALGPPGGAQR